jgi:hypothetical protein
VTPRDVCHWQTSRDGWITSRLCARRLARNGIASGEAKGKKATEPAYESIDKKGKGLGQQGAEVRKRSDSGELHMEHKRPRGPEDDERGSVLLDAHVL